MNNIFIEYIIWAYLQIELVNSTLIASANTARLYVLTCGSYFFVVTNRSFCLKVVIYSNLIYILWVKPGATEVGVAMSRYLYCDRNTNA